jgi:DNA-binding beta-propeller fold protein YncE
LLVRRSTFLTLGVGLVLAACANPQPGDAPPGLTGSGPALFWPVAVAVDPTGANLYVANSNFDRAYTSGWVAQFPTSLFDKASDGSIVPLKPSDALSVGNTDSFAGAMLLRTVGTPAVASRLFLSTREHPAGKHCTLGNQCGGLTSVPLDRTNGHLLCPSAGCSLDAVDLTQFNIGSTKYQMTDPSPMTFAPQLLLPDGTRADTLAITNLSPSPSGQPGVGLDAVVAFLKIPDDTTPPVAAKTSNPFSSIVSAVKIGNVGANSIAYGNGVLYAGGCYTRVAGETIVPCLADPSITEYRLNPLRFFFGGSLEHASVNTASLGTFFAGGETKDIAISSDGKQIYVANAIPNALLVIDAPQPGGSPVPTLRATIPLANEPNRLLVLPRPGLPDLIAVTSADPNVVLANSSALLLVDPQTATVRTQLEPLGRTPYGMTSVRLPVAAPDHTRLYVTLFGGCGVAAVDVPDATPEAAKHVSTLGSCP